MACLTLAASLRVAGPNDQPTNVKPNIEATVLTTRPTLATMYSNSHALQTANQMRAKPHMNGGPRLDHGKTPSEKGLAPHLTNGVSENGAAAEGELLKMVLDVVLRANLVTGIDASEKILEFKHPKELKELVDVEVERDGCSLEEAGAVLEQVVRYSVKTQHPHFYNQLFGGIDEVALTGAWMTEALNTSQYTFEVAPVFMLVEHYVLSLLVRLYGWPDGDGIFAPGGSVSNMYSMVLARYKKHPHVKRTGMHGHKPLIAFTSDQGHYSVSKSASWLGLGMDNVVHVPSDAEGRMIPEALREAVAAARAKGGEPFYVNATAGTTVLGAYDPLEQLADVCDEEDLWLHVDGCWGGVVILSKRYKHFLKGVDRADSISWNPHKMLGTCLQCSAFLTRHKSLLHQCNSARATYLFQQDKYYDVTYDTGDKSVQCGRKVDAFKLWIYLKFHGLDLLEKRIDDTFSASRYLSQQVAARPGFRLLQEPQCTNVCFWYIPPSMRGRPETPEWWVKLAKVAPALKARMVRQGTLMIGYQPIASKNLVNFFRMVTTCTPTPTHADMDFVLDEIERLGADL
ncbi:cysteine sulfinic acid decarboxylase-like isoform X2 [Panulirus ornatus]|uniref:cysteine sulfinic acid decarboxylase-like isoform X2 n=1 Tax=Panulirus ornatus TaxID=150431 RepID=UPI003A8B54AB